MLQRRLVPLCGLGAGLPELGTPRRSGAVKAAAVAALASTGREARAQAFTARTAWDNGTRGKPAPRLDVRRLSGAYFGMAEPAAEKRPHRKAVEPRSTGYPLPGYHHEISPSVADYVVTRSLGARIASSAPALRQRQRNHVTPFRGPGMSIDFGPLEELR